ncbi:MAG TPA: septum formation initiator family protein [Bryobacteraceae bacterium]|nr:septum formation initiator family protein [Bryobacteraceae bacterium]
MRHPVLKGVYAVMLAVGIVYAFVELRGPNGIPALMERRRMVHQYEAENLKLNREIQQYQERIQRLQDNPTEQEFEIRQRLKLAKPNEKIYIIEPGPKK